MKRSKKGFTLIEMMIVLIIMGVLLTILIPTWNYFITQSKISTQNKNSRVIFNAAQTECTKQKFQIRNLKAEIESLEKDLASKQSQINNAKSQYLIDHGTGYSSTNATFEAALADPTIKDNWTDALLNEFNDWDNIRKMESTLASLPDQIANAKSKYYLKNYDGKDENTNEDIFKDFYFYWDGSTGISCDVNLNTLNRDPALDKAFADAITKGIETPENVAYKLHIKDYNVVSVVCAKNSHDKNIGAYPKQQNERSNSDLVHFNFSDAEN